MKSVIITGCSTGLGYFLAKEFIKKSYKVICISRNSNKELLEIGCSFIKTDINDYSQIDKALEKIEAVDILINNAGYAQFGPLTDLDIKSIEDQFKTNFFAPLYLIKKCIPILLKSDNPKVVNIGSMSGILPTPFAGAYCSSKSGINMYTDVLRMELSPFGIKVIKVLPGIFRSNFGNRAQENLFINKNSIYRDIGKKLKKRSYVSQSVNTNTGKYARGVVKRLIKYNSPYLIYTGKGAFSVLLFRRLIPARLLDFILKKFNGI